MTQIQTIAAPVSPRVPCQVLYDLRELTGFISGSELHGLFREQLGDPSPSGNKIVSLEVAEAIEPRLRELLDAPYFQVRAWIETYSEFVPVDPPVGGTLREMGLDLVEWAADAVEQKRNLR